MAVTANLSAGQVLTASTVNTYMINSGLVYVGGTTATSGSTVDVLGCFTSTYDSYKVVVTDLRTTGGVTDVNIQMLAGSTANASNWMLAVSRVEWATSALNVYKNSSLIGMLGSICSANSLGYEFIVAQPKLPRYTTIAYTGHDSRGSSGYMAISASGQLENTTQYDGLRINIGASVFANVTVRVYGYRQA